MRGKQCILVVSNGLSIYIFITNTLGSCSCINGVSIQFYYPPNIYTCNHSTVGRTFSWGSDHIKNRFGSSTNKLRNMTETKTIQAVHFRYVSQIKNVFTWLVLTVESFYLPCIDRPPLQNNWTSILMVTVPDSVSHKGNFSVTGPLASLLIADKFPPGPLAI